MKQYLEMAERVLTGGRYKEDRTGTGTYSLFGQQMRFDLRLGFPLVTTKKLHLKSIIHELLWFLKGETNIKYLKDNGVTIWDEWADENGDLGPVYGSQWRAWPGELEYVKHDHCPQDNAKHSGAEDEIGAWYHKPIDQIQKLMDTLRNNPDSRRIIVSAWNVAEVDNMKLPPCHAFFQFYTCEMTLDERRDYYAFKVLRDGSYPDIGFFSEEAEHAFLTRMDIPTRFIDCQLYQRSCDVFLGVPFNIASYALLMMMVGQQANMVPRDFVWSGGDVHIYKNHVQQMGTQLMRRDQTRPLPIMTINKTQDIFSYTYDDFMLSNYDPHPAIKAPVAV